MIDTPDAPLQPLQRAPSDAPPNSIRKIVADEGEIPAHVVYQGAGLSHGFAQFGLGGGEFDGPIPDFMDMVEADRPLFGGGRRARFLRRLWGLFRMRRFLHSRWSADGRYGAASANM
jgi:hypothetical protein